LEAVVCATFLFLSGDSPHHVRSRIVELSKRAWNKEEERAGGKFLEKGERRRK